MKANDFLKAIEILSSNHSTGIVVNQPRNGFVGDLGSKEFTIHITKCCVSVVNKLIEAGYSLSMTESVGLSVEKY